MLLEIFSLVIIKVDHALRMQASMQNNKYFFLKNKNKQQFVKAGEL
jgi:hypothetical protein